MSVKYNADRIIIIDLLYLGDLIFATPFIRNIRKNFPHSRIDMVVNSNFSSIIEDTPYLDNIYPYDKRWGIKLSIDFTKALKRNNYSLGINIHGNWRSALLLKNIKPAYSIGYGGGGRGLFLNKVIEVPDHLHMVINYMELLKNIGLDIKDHKGTEIAVNQESLKKMEEFLEENAYLGKKKIVGLNTGGSWPIKRWPAEKFASLADRLINNNFFVVFLGSKSDRPRVDQIISSMKSKALIATSKTSLKELVALESLCDLVISNDSGPVHVAAAVGTPTITIFGPSDDNKYRPLGDKHKIVKNEIECRPCGEHECPLGHHRCMQDIGVDDVIEVVNMVNLRR